MITAKDLSKNIHDREVLSQVSLTLSPGEIVSVIGPSGAGKTTLLRALALIDRPDSGELQIDELSYKFPLDPKSSVVLPYPRLTVVFQQLFVWPHLTIRENLLLPLKHRTYDEAHFSQLITMFKMGSYLDRYPNQTSIGERQRAALVRGLLLRPSYLLLDEVTSALDVEQSQLIVDHLRDIANQGVGLFVVSHAIHLAKKVSDKIIFMEKGSVVECGSSKIIDQPQTERLSAFLNFSS